MIIIKAYKTRIMPDGEQAEYLFGCCGAARFVYNWALADRKTAYEERGETINKFEQKRRFNAWKYDNAEWITEYPYVIVEYAFNHLDSAYKHFFRRNRQGTEKPGFPRFKSRHHSRKSFTVAGSIHVERSRIKLPKMGWIELKEHGYIPSAPLKICYATVSIDAGKWYVSVTVHEEIEDPVVESTHVVGVDMGYGMLVTTSDNDRYDNLRALSRYEKKLKRLQRELSRRKKDSSNRAKTRAKIAALHKKIANARRHHAHDVSSNLSDKDFGTVVMEDFHIRKMMEGENRHTGRNKRMADAGIGELRRQVEYKAGWKGKEVIRTPKDEPTNRRCSACGEVADRVGLVEKWVCKSCGVEHDRRLNTAQNMVQYVQSQE